MYLNVFNIDSQTVLTNKKLSFNLRFSISSKSSINLLKSIDFSNSSAKGLPEISLNSLF